MANETEAAAGQATEAAGHVAEAAGHAAEKAGMPQLDFATFPNQIFWLLVALVVIYLVLSRIALPRIASILAERQAMMTNDIAAAEDLKQKAEAAEAAYNQALVDARAEAQKIVAQARLEIHADLEVATAKADAQIAARTSEGEARIAEIRAGAEAAVAEVSKETAAALVAALGGKADAKSITAAIAARMKG